MNSKLKIKKVLIPNRGEIAVRIQRTCRELGITTAVVYSERDRGALHVRYADEAYFLPGSTIGETYLNRELLLDIAKKCKADAIHPGYGFLSENAGFARECENSGIIFIGPPPEAMEKMGFKTEARKLMQAAGVPVVPGTPPLDSVEEATKHAGKIGYPVLLKASAGGGGKGMRLIASPDLMEAAFDACRREAQSAFGDNRVYIEKYLVKPRHVEFQVLGDKFGKIIHLFERECSVQRRHQKIIEETPSPALNEELRSRMGETAVAAAKACGYYNAGTIEFLLDENKNYYFLEMNTRLQVEHPITEMVTGLDLVEQQIRIAAGEHLDTGPLSQRGAAMECRIYAEDPDNNFLPSPGKIRTLLNPGGPGVRNDSGIYAGYTVSMDYDPMLSKLAVKGKNREQVLARMQRALEEHRLTGVRTNISYLRKILKHPTVISGDYDTQFIDKHHDALMESEKEHDHEEIAALVSAGLITYLNDLRHSTHSNENPGDSNSPSIPSAWKLYSRLQDKGRIF
ncbi:MAG: acetyl-CoA carboxylase biotin carboxylase subunit [bacterium]|nr:acetyl-CoA carboxylase biotin carboxylase subunit [bacterium]